MLFLTLKIEFFFAIYMWTNFHRFYSSLAVKSDSENCDLTYILSHSEEFAIQELFGYGNTVGRKMQNRGS